MKNIIIIVLVLAVAKAETVNSNQERNSVIRTDKYIEKNREQYSLILKKYEAQMEEFNRIYIERVSAVNVDFDIAVNCINDASNQVNNLMFSALSIKNALENYLDFYEKNLEDCGANFEKSTKNYAICVVRTTFTTNKFTIGNRRAFSTIMETAECTIKAYYNKAWDCDFVFKQA